MDICNIFRDEKSRFENLATLKKKFSTNKTEQ